MSSKKSSKKISNKDRRLSAVSSMKKTIADPNYGGIVRAHLAKASKFMEVRPAPKPGKKGDLIPVKYDDKKPLAQQIAEAKAARLGKKAAAKQLNQAGAAAKRKAEKLAAKQKRKDMAEEAKLHRQETKQAKQIERRKARLVKLADKLVSGEESRKSFIENGLKLNNDELKAEITKWRQQVREARKAEREAKRTSKRVVKYEFRRTEKKDIFEFDGNLPAIPIPEKLLDASIAFMQAKGFTGAVVIQDGRLILKGANNRTRNWLGSFVYGYLVGTGFYPEAK